QHLLTRPFLSLRPRPLCTLFPYTTLSRSHGRAVRGAAGSRRSTAGGGRNAAACAPADPRRSGGGGGRRGGGRPPPARALTDSGADRKSTRLNSSHVKISYAVFCLKKKKVR